VSAVAASSYAPPVVHGVVRQLTRVEFRMLLRHPLMLGAVALSALGIVSAVPPALTMSAATLVACHLCTSRNRRNGTEEHVGSLPAPVRMETASHLLSIGSAIGVAALLSVPFLWILATRPVAEGGPDEILTPVFAVALFFHGLSRVASLGALGVLLGRWIPTSMAGPVAVVATGLLSSFPISPLFFWPDEDILAKTASMLVLAAISAALALVVEPLRRPRMTPRV
jgi:hypothetical protein